jgi:predicted negative regulator of RcsB-dependent stress response
MIRLLSQVALQVDTAKSMAFGEIRTELYPESWRAREFLGDLWAARGDAEKARAYYQQALQLGGDSAALREKLQKLGE